MLNEHCCTSTTVEVEKSEKIAPISAGGADHEPNIRFLNFGDQGKSR